MCIFFTQFCRPQCQIEPFQHRPHHSKKELQQSTWFYCWMTSVWTQFQELNIQLWTMCSFDPGFWNVALLTILFNRYLFFYMFSVHYLISPKTISLFVRSLSTTFMHRIRKCLNLWHVYITDNNILFMEKRSSKHRNKCSCLSNMLDVKSPHCKRPIKLSFWNKRRTLGSIMPSDRGDVSRIYH